MANTPSKPRYPQGISAFVCRTHKSVLGIIGSRREIDAAFHAAEDHTKQGCKVAGARIYNGKPDHAENT